MAYLVLARKYRPTTFSEVIGQDHVTRTLGNAFASERVHHAFLFCGPRGCGKTTLARIVGKALNCERGPTAEPCGTCSACSTIGNGSAVDYQEMDGASNRGIDAIRELTEAVRYQPAQLRKKVYVIDEVHMLTTEAFNALLKTLEEPPPHVTFVLATTEPHKLPNTILSRCQRYDFKLVTAAKLAAHLTAIFAKEQLAIEANAIGLLVRESGGSVRDALSLSDQIISYVGADHAITEKHVAEVLGVADRSLTRTLVGALATGDAAQALVSVEDAINRGVDEVQIARAIVRYLRDLSVCQVAGERAKDLIDATNEELVSLASEASGLDRSRVTQMFERMLRCCDELGKTLQPRLVLDCALIDVAHLEPLVPLGDLIERLGDLEHRLAGKPGARAAYTPPAQRDERAAMRMTAPGNPVGGSRAPAPAPAPTPAPAPQQAAPMPAPTPAAKVAPPAEKPVAKAAFKETQQGVPAPIPATKSAPVSMAPSGPVPVPSDAANGSGPEGQQAIPQSAAEAMKAWDRVLDELMKRRKVVLFGYCEHARILAWNTEELVLGYSSALHHFGEEVGKAADELRGVMRELYRGNPKVVVKMLDASDTTSARSVIEATREKSANDRKDREREAREHPITKHVLQTFGASIKEIKTDV